MEIILMTLMGNDHLYATCSKCDVTTIFQSKIRYRLSGEKAVALHFQFQCQNCGKLVASNECNNINEIQVALTEPCECGGQFRRDKNIFCPSCLHRKSDKNSFSPLLSIPKNMYFQ